MVLIRKFRSRNFIHIIERVWDTDGDDVLPEMYNAAYAHMHGPLNLRGVCGERALWIWSFADVAVVDEKEPITCLTCIGSR